MVEDKYFETVEKLTPIAQLLTELGRADNSTDVNVYSPVVFEAMGREVWSVYISLCQYPENRGQEGDIHGSQKTE
jgi:hypothetical protein